MAWSQWAILCVEGYKKFRLSNKLTFLHTLDFAARLQNLFILFSSFRTVQICISLYHVRFVLLYLTNTYLPCIRAYCSLRTQFHISVHIIHTPSLKQFIPLLISFYLYVYYSIMSSYYSDQFYVHLYHSYFHSVHSCTHSNFIIYSVHAFIHFTHILVPTIHTFTLSFIPFVIQFVIQIIHIFIQTS